MSTDTNKEIDIGSPDTEVSVKKIFGIDSDLTIPAFKKTNEENMKILFNGYSSTEKYFIDHGHSL